MKLSNFWLSSLAVTDILMAAFVMPVATYFNTMGPWAMGGALCKVSDSWGGSYTCRVSHLCLKNVASITGCPSRLRSLVWLNYIWAFHHPAWAVGSYNSGPPAWETQ